jgi:hypothetical protein
MVEREAKVASGRALAADDTLGAKEKKPKATSAVFVRRIRGTARAIIIMTAMMEGDGYVPPTGDGANKIRKNKESRRVNQSPRATSLGAILVERLRKTHTTDCIGTAKKGNSLPIQLPAERSEV